MGDIYTNPPQSRNEAILRATIDGTKYEAPPQSRMEDLLVELKAAIEQGGGIGSYNDLNNKPQINSVTLQGDKSISDLFDGKVDIGTVEESGYAELKDENGDRIFRASSANGEATVESGALIGQPGALVLYNGEGGVGSISPKGGARLVDVDLPAESGTLALDSQIASSQTPAKAAVVTVNDAAPINAEDITVDITPVQDLHGYDRPWAGGAGKNKLPLVLADIKAANATLGTWVGNTYTYNGVSFTVETDNDGNVTGISADGTTTGDVNLELSLNQTLAKGTYTLSHGPLANANTNAYLYVRDVEGQTTLIDVNLKNANSKTVLIPNDMTNVKYYINIRTGVTLNGTILPQLELGEQATSFAPYSNECPIEGWTGAELDRVGKNKFMHPFIQSFPMTFCGVTIIDDNGRLTINNTCTNGFNAILVGNSSAAWGSFDNAKSLPMPDGDYTFSGGDETAKIWINQYRNDGLLHTYGLGAQPIVISVLSTDLFEISIRLNKDTTYNNLTISPQIEAGSSPSAFSPYQGEQYTASFGETVYGGKWHVTAGDTDKTHGNIASYNGETVNEPWLSSLDEYVAGATPTTGAQVVYPLTTPTTISTPKQNVPMLQGINTVSANCGAVGLKYQPDNVIGELKGMIQEVESELDKLDKSDMASDDFSEIGIDGVYQITRIGNEIHITAVIDDASIATRTGSVDLIADLPDEFKCNPSFEAAFALRHSSGTGKIEFKINPGVTRQNFYMYVEEVNTTSGVWFPIYDVPSKAL